MMGGLLKSHLMTFQRPLLLVCFKYLLLKYSSAKSKAIMKMLKVSDLQNLHCCHIGLCYYNMNDIENIKGQKKYE